MKEATMNAEEARAICQRFANEHKVIFEDEGEVGFGRECVGFQRGEAYVDYNPTNRTTYEEIEEFACPGAEPPDTVPDAYHKHDCLAVLGRGDDVIMQLAAWVEHMEKQGDVSIVSYPTGATGPQLLFTGVRLWTVMIEESS